MTIATGRARREPRISRHVGPGGGRQLRRRMASGGRGSVATLDRIENAAHHNVVSSD